MAVYYDEKQKTWYAKFRYKDWQGNNHWATKRGFPRKKDAQLYEHDYKNKAIQNPTLTINTLISEYLEDYKLNHKESSYRTVKRILERHVKPYFNNAPLVDITPYKIKCWQNELAKTNAAESSTKTYNVVFNTLMNYAVKYHGVTRNPFSVTGTTGKMAKSMDFWEHEEFKKFDAAMVDDPIYRVMFNILFYSGIRVGELMGLTVNDFDFTNNTIIIDKQYNTDYGTLTIPKTAAGKRTITLPVSIMAMVKDLFDSFYVIPEPRPFALTTRHGLAFVLQKYADKAGVRRIKLHDLRHSHASMLIKQGANVSAIAKRLGHSSPATTLNVYSHVYHNEDFEIADMLDKSI